VLGEDRYVKAAERAAEFVLGQLRKEGRLMRYARNGRVQEKGFLDDYAFVIRGLLDLYEAAFDARWLREAVGLADEMIDLFGDQDRGGSFLAGRDIEGMLARDKPDYDGAVPSGNSVAALVLVKLGKITTSQRLISAGERTFQAFSGPMSESPTSVTAMLRALDFSLGPTQEIVIAGSETPSEAQSLIDEVRRHFLPGAVLMFHPTGPDAEAIEAVVPFVENLGPVGDRAAAYVCEDYTCQLPVADPAALRKVLADISRKD